MKRCLTLSLAILPSFLILLSCGKETEKMSESLVGEWNVVSITTKSAVIGSREVDVYLHFGDDGTFAVYQKTGGLRYVRFTGTWTLDSGILSGVYADGGKWACDYKVSLAGGTLTLSSESTPSEISVYKMTEIPESVKENAIEGLTQ